MLGDEMFVWMNQIRYTSGPDNPPEITPVCVNRAEVVYFSYKENPHGDYYKHWPDDNVFILRLSTGQNIWVTCDAGSRLAAALNGHIPSILPE